MNETKSPRDRLDEVYNLSLSLATKFADIAIKPVQRPHNNGSSTSQVMEYTAGAYADAAIKCLQVAGDLVHDDVILKKDETIVGAVNHMIDTMVPLITQLLQKPIDPAIVDAMIMYEVIESCKLYAAAEGDEQLCDLLPKCKVAVVGEIKFDIENKPIGRVQVYHNDTLGWIDSKALLQKTVEPENNEPSPGPDVA